MRIRKDLSVCFSVDTVITSQDIIVGLDKAGIDIDSITAIQRRASNNSWVVTFDCKAVKDAAMNEHSIDIAGCSVLIGDCENRVSIVKIYELPDELPDCRNCPSVPLRQSYFFSQRPRGRHHLEWRSYRVNVHRPAHSLSNVHRWRVRPPLVSFAAQDVLEVRLGRPPSGCVQVTALLQLRAARPSR